MAMEVAVAIMESEMVKLSLPFLPTHPTDLEATTKSQEVTEPLVVITEATTMGSMTSLMVEDQAQPLATEDLVDRLQLTSHSVFQVAMLWMVEEILVEADQLLVEPTVTLVHLLAAEDHHQDHSAIEDLEEFLAQVEIEALATLASAMAMEIIEALSTLDLTMVMEITEALATQDSTMAMEITEALATQDLVAMEITESLETPDLVVMEITEALATLDSVATTTEDQVATEIVMEVVLQDLDLAAPGTDLVLTAITTEGQLLDLERTTGALVDVALDLVPPVVVATATDLVAIEEVDLVLAAVDHHLQVCNIFINLLNILNQANYFSFLSFGFYSYKIVTALIHQ